MTLRKTNVEGTQRDLYSIVELTASLKPCELDAITSCPVGARVPRQVAETSEWTLKLLPAQPIARRTLDNASPQHKLVQSYLMRPQEDGDSSEHDRILECM